MAEEAILKETFCPRKVLIAGSIGPYELSYDSGLRHGKKLGISIDISITTLIELYAIDIC